MDPRLEEASVTGNLGLLHQLLHENRFLLDTTTLYSMDNPVHIAASLGHASFIHEIIIRNLRLAGELNSQGLSPLHLAAANGHVDAVRELVKSSSDLCLVRSYKEGMMPIHFAAAKGRTGVLGELMDACPASVKAASHRGSETVFHLAVASGCLEAVKLVMDKMGDDVGDMLRMRDDKGNTALHIAVARKQFQVVKLMLSKSVLTDVNVTNIKGFTPLDILLESPSENGDLALGELIWAAGGRTATEAEPPASALAAASLTSTTTHRPRRIVEEDHSNYQNTPGTLMVVATLIATITFQAGMNPPGGFMQANVSTAITGQRRRRDGRPSKGEAQALPFAGQAVLGDNLTWFLIFDVVGLFASLSIILLLICVIPSRKKMVMGVLVWVMWVAVFCTALAFQSAIVLIYKEDDMVIGVLANAWFGLLRVTVVWISIRFVVYLLRWAGWMKKKGRQEAESSRVRRGVLVAIRRMVAVVLIAAVVAATCYVNFKLQSWIN